MFPTCSPSAEGYGNIMRLKNGRPALRSSSSVKALVPRSAQIRCHFSSMTVGSYAFVVVDSLISASPHLFITNPKYNHAGWRNIGFRRVGKGAMSPAEPREAARGDERRDERRRLSPGTGRRRR